MQNSNFSNPLLILGDTRITGHHGSNTVIQVLFQQLDMRGLEFEIVSNQQNLEDILAKKIFAAVIINGEGSLHGRSRSAIKYAQVCKICAVLGIPCFIINSVLDNLESDILEQLAKCTKIYCRETASLAVAQEFGIFAGRCADLTFASDFHPEISWEKNSQKIVVTDSTVDNVNRRLHKFAIDNKLEYLPLRTQLGHIDFSTFKSPVREVKFSVRHLLGKLISGSYQIDRFGKAERHFHDFANRLNSDTQFVLCGRFHGVCFCLKWGIPFLAVESNTHKIQGLLDDANLSHKLLKLRSDESNSGKGLAFENIDVPSSGLISALAERASWTHQDERNRLAYIQNARTEITKCFDEILQAIANQNSRSKKLVHATI